MAEPKEQEAVVAISDARKHIAELIDVVERERMSVIITRNKRPVARLVPVAEQPTPEFLRVVGSVIDDERGVLKALE